MANRQLLSISPFPVISPSRLITISLRDTVAVQRSQLKQRASQFFLVINSILNDPYLRIIKNRINNEEEFINAAAI